VMLAAAVQEAIAALSLKRLILLTPYEQDVNDHEIDYFRQIGVGVVGDVALALAGSDDYLAQPPERWLELAIQNAREDADGYFLSCTNTTQIEAIAPIERRLGKPVINSNQAVVRGQTAARQTRFRALRAGARAAARERLIISP
jgi:maleate isomerase